MDYYTILEINKNATQEEIKKQYKKKAVLCHPDKKGGSEDKFKELSEAYNVLSDAQKRREYDIFGTNQNLHQNTNDSVFNMFFNNMNFYNPHQQHQSQQQQPKEIINKNIEVTIEMNLEEIYKGLIKPLSFLKNEKCNNCINNPINVCETCNGTGKLICIRQFGPMLQHIEKICVICAGKGAQKINNNNCIICKGKSVISMRKNIQIKIQKGITPNHKIVINNEGHQDLNDSPGNLILTFKELPHDKFIRDKHNLLLKKDVNVYDILFKNKIDINHLDNKQIYIEASTEDMLCIKNEGMFIFTENESSSNLRGDLYLVFNVIYPKQTIPKTININISNNIIKKSIDNILIDNNELLSLLFDQKNNEIKFLKHTICKTHKISTNIKNKIKKILYANIKHDDLDLENDECTTQ